MAVIGIQAYIDLPFVTKSNIDADEVEHAHVIWALNQGIMPYRDIHQIHTPMLWIMMSPVMRCLPESVVAMIALRGLCALAFLGTYAVGLLVLREVNGALRWTHALVMLLLSLSIFFDFGFHQFRPDPFMTLCTALGILAAMRLRRAPRKNSFLCGLAFGFAVSLSPKMAPLCLLMPILCLLEWRQSRTLRPWGLVIPYGLGFVLGLAPAAMWLVGQGLFGDFRHWVLAHNVDRLNVFEYRTWQSIDRGKFLTLLALAGALVMRRAKSTATAEPWKPSRCLFVAAALAWLLPLIEPNHLMYNAQVFAMPGCVLATLLVARLVELDHWPWKLQSVLAALLVLCLVTGSAMRGTTLRVRGYSVPHVALQKLMDAGKSSGATCVGFAPWHPIFCRDATDLYMAWEQGPDVQGCVSPAGRRVYQEMWQRAMTEIFTKQPTMIVGAWVWESAFKDGLINREQYFNLQRLLQSRYRKAATVQGGEIGVFLHHDQ
ncbi:MAG: hypothetical protein ABFC96_08710 [Thermoguttaceae bacterium]